MGIVANNEIAVVPELNPYQRKIVEALKNGNTRRAAAAYAGVSHMTFYRWIESNVTFSDAVKVAEATAEVGHVQCVAQAAMKGNWTASAWWLERRRPKDWREIKTIDIRDIPTERLLELLEGTDTGGVETARGLEVTFDPDRTAEVE